MPSSSVKFGDAGMEVLMWYWTGEVQSTAIMNRRDIVLSHREASTNLEQRVQCNAILLLLLLMLSVLVLVLLLITVPRGGGNLALANRRLSTPVQTSLNDRPPI